MKTNEDKTAEEIEKYIKHAPGCWLNQNWQEALDAFSDTPLSLRDDEYYTAVNEICQKQTTCNCDYDKILKKLQDSGKTSKIGWLINDRSDDPVSVMDCSEQTAREYCVNTGCTYTGISIFKRN